MQTNILPNLKEEIYRRVSIPTLICRTVQFNAMDLLRTCEKGCKPPSRPK